MLPRRGGGLGEGSRTYLPPLLAGPALRVKHHHCRRERGRGRKDVRSARPPPPRPSGALGPQVPSLPTLVPPTGVGLGEGVEVQQVSRERDKQTDSEWIILEPTTGTLPRGGHLGRHGVQITPPSPVTTPCRGPALSAPWTTPEISALELFLCGLDASRLPPRAQERGLAPRTLPSWGADPTGSPQPIPSSLRLSPLLWLGLFKETPSPRPLATPLSLHPRFSPAPILLLLGSTPCSR